ncbi:glycosyltransferase [Alphaproteobacteria bacterium]|nr:glycosyltransferase [Alphaproteobacteria bacterium]
MVDLITVGITCYNAETTIDRCIDSALAQTWSNTEILIIDDASTDGSWEKISKYIKKYRNIKAFRQDQNGGYPSALNKIVSTAHGEYLAFFDSDDYSSPDRLAKQVSRIKEYQKNNNTDLIFCYSNRAVIRQNEKLPAHIAPAIGRKAPEPFGVFVANFILGDNQPTDFCLGIFGSCTLMVSNKNLKLLGPFDEGFTRSAEWDIAIRFAQINGHFIAVNEALVTQFKTSGAHKSGNKPLLFSLKLREKHKEFLKAQNFYLASRMIARSNFYGIRKHYIVGLFFRICAFIIKPTLFINYLINRIKIST